MDSHVSKPIRTAELFGNMDELLSAAQLSLTD
jgi:hypothetical protein